MRAVFAGASGKTNLTSGFSGPGYVVDLVEHGESASEVLSRAKHTVSMLVSSASLPRAQDCTVRDLLSVSLIKLVDLKQHSGHWQACQGHFITSAGCWLNAIFLSCSGILIGHAALSQWHVAQVMQLCISAIADRLTEHLRCTCITPSYEGRT